MRILLAISGASGAVYGARTGELLVGAGVELHLLVTPTAWEILAAELPGDDALPDGLAARHEWLAVRMKCHPSSFRLHPEHDFSIPFTSGSNPPDAMIVAPCSMGTAARIAHGLSSSVLLRCADVALKEKKPLVLLPREMPFSVIHLENLLTLSRAGAEILPACPGFYHRPQAVSELVDFVVARILARVGIDADLHAKWGADKA
ncbi:MAG TPA: flavin prenyltransferase UbiX [Candidatus Deferrimicrobiaceae bacterium]